MNSASAQVVQIDWVGIAAIVVSMIFALITGVWVIARLVTNAFHDVDKRIYGIAKVIEPYSERFAEQDQQLKIHADKLAKLEATQDARSSIIDRHERMIEALQRR